ncbi:MAG: Smr/MutS family protein [Deltaproteobacteria bacterium]|nr:Smr/MutS family protein [Deltaproteobacteria bacterium]
MAAKRKKKKTPQKAPTFSNRPFIKIKAALSTPETDASPPPSTELPPPGESDSAAYEVLTEEDEEAAILSQMMDGAMPIEHKRAEKQHRIKDTIHTIDDAELVMRHLDELIHGKADFDIADTDEYIEASISGLDRRIVKKLRKGEYSIQAHIDLHGMNREEARGAVATFIDRSFKSGKKCVLIVHGRGLGSENNIPVLKEKLRAWLTRGAMGKKVLAYTSARPFDGGTGAVYVLLRS